MPTDWLQPGDSGGGGECGGGQEAAWRSGGRADDDEGRAVPSPAEVCSAADDDAQPH